MPGFAAWLARERANEASEVLDAATREALRLARRAGWHLEPAKAERVRAALIPLAAHYFLKAQDPGRPAGRSGGALPSRQRRAARAAEFPRRRLANGLKQSHGLMVNYLYALDEIETNHEAFAEKGVIAASPAVRKALRAPPLPAA